jgi:dihydropyrimidinase
MSLLLRNGRIVTSTKTEQADILIEDEKIKDISPQIPVDRAHRVIDVTNMLLFPGGIDVHTHLDMPFGGTTSSDDFETGTKAAAFGGTTTLIDFAIQPRRRRLSITAST